MINSLSKACITEIKSFNNPPSDVATVMNSVLVLLEKEPTWANAKKELGDTNFVNKLKGYDKDNVKSSTLKKLSKYVRMENF